MAEHLMTLLGCVVNPEREGEYSADPDQVLLHELPEVITAGQFGEELLGLSTEAY